MTIQTKIDCMTHHHILHSGGNWIRHFSVGISLYRYYVLKTTTKSMGSTAKFYRSEKKYDAIFRKL